VTLPEPMRSLVDYDMQGVASELSQEFFDAWIDSLREGWGGLLGSKEDWYFWMFIGGSRGYV
jgi:hypothetical protein